MTRIRFPKYHQINGASGQYSFDRIGSVPAGVDAEDLAAAVGHNLTDADFEAAGLRADIASTYTNPKAARKRVRQLRKSGRSDVPVGAYIIKRDERPIGVVNLARDEDSVIPMPRFQKILAKLHLRNRDSGSRLLTGWINTELAPSEAPELAIVGGIEIARLAGVLAVRADAMGVPRTPRLDVLEECTDILQSVGAQVRSDLSSRTVEGDEYEGTVWEVGTRERTA